MPYPHSVKKQEVAKCAWKSKTATMQLATHLVTHALRDVSSAGAPEYYLVKVASVNCARHRVPLLSVPSLEPPTRGSPTAQTISSYHRPADAYVARLKEIHCGFYFAELSRCVEPCAVQNA